MQNSSVGLVQNSTGFALGEQDPVFNYFISWLLRATNTSGPLVNLGFNTIEILVKNMFRACVTLVLFVATHAAHIFQRKYSYAPVNYGTNKQFSQPSLFFNFIL